MNISRQQITAARGLLEWSQQDLADASGVDRTTISRVESGKSVPDPVTTDAIVRVFSRAGVVFTQTGVECRAGEWRYEGDAGLRAFFDEVYESASSGGDIAIFNGVPEALIRHLGAEWYAAHADRMAAITPTPSVRVVIREGDASFIGARFAVYRWFPADRFHEKTIYVYGDRVAFLNFDGGQVRVLVVGQKETADSVRVLFDIAWDRATVPPTQELDPPCNTT